MPASLDGPRVPQSRSLFVGGVRAEPCPVHGMKRQVTITLLAANSAPLGWPPTALDAARRPTRGIPTRPPSVPLHSSRPPSTVGADRRVSDGECSRSSDAPPIESRPRRCLDTSRTAGSLPAERRRGLSPARRGVGQTTHAPVDGEAARQSFGTSEELAELYVQTHLASRTFRAGRPFWKKNNSDHHSDNLEDNGWMLEAE